MLTIGLTGGIATGKSAVARLLAAQGARVIDADAVARDVYAAGSDGYDAVVAGFGAAVVGSDGAIDRAALGRLVFADEARRRQLTDIVWPLARRQVEALQAQARADGVEVLVIEAALLIEAGWQDLVDETWLVRTPDATARARIIAREGLESTAADARLAAQPAASTRLPHVQTVIDNDSDRETLEKRVLAAWQTALTRVR